MGDGSVDEIVTMHEYLNGTRDFVSRLFLVSTFVTQRFSFLRREGAFRDETRMTFTLLLLY